MISGCVYIYLTLNLFHEITARAGDIRQWLRTVGGSRKDGISLALRIGILIHLTQGDIAFLQQVLEKGCLRATNLIVFVYINQREAGERTLSIFLRCEVEPVEIIGRELWREQHTHESRLSCALRSSEHEHHARSVSP